MEKRTFILSIIIKPSKLLQNGEAPIYVRITISRQRTELSLNRSISPKQWDNKKGRAKGVSKTSIELNNYLENTKNQLYNCYLKLEKEEKDITPQSLKKLFLYGESRERYLLLNYIRQYIDKITKLVGIDITASTIQRYNITYRLFETYLKKNKLEEIYLDEVNSSIISEFIYYLKSERKCQHNTVVKYVRAIARILREAIKEGKITAKEEELGLSIRAEESIPIYLTKDELNALINKELTVDRLDAVRDVFVFCCFSGLAFVDVKQLSKSNLEKDNNGNTWIRIKRQKTGVPAHILLLDIPLKLIEKYSQHPYCKSNDVLLPVYSNQKQNAYLKEIANLCGIRKNLVTHCARHTFSTTVTLANKVSMESVSKMLGHSDIRMTKHYAKILDETVEREMQELKNIWK